MYNFITRFLWQEFANNNKNLADYIINNDVQLVFGLGVPTGASANYCSKVEQYWKVS